MKNKNVAFRILNDYLFKYHNEVKIYFLISFGILLAGISILEPFFMKELISLVEIYIKTNTYELSEFYKIFIFWSIFIVLVLFLRGIYELLDSFFGILIIISILFYIDYRMAFITLAMLPFMIYIGYVVNSKTYHIQHKINKIRDSAFGEFGNAFGNLGLVKTLTLENKFNKILSEKIYKAYKNQLGVTKRWIASDVYTGFLVMISRFLVLSTGIYFLINGSLTFATLFFFFSYIGYIYFPLSFIFGNLKNIQKQLSAVGDLYNECDNLNYDVDKERGKKLNNVRGNVEFKKVKFGYLKNKNILDGVSFNIVSGEKNAFVGNTGAGKSTIVNLLFRFWDTDSGEILLDGKNINTIRKKSLRKHIGIVMQDNSLFNMSIKDNLLFANPKATKKDIKKALLNAEAGFVYYLKEGINTIIGERGLKLSGGEKQRLAIARLFIKNPKILILDEATSALDNKTEKLVQKALDKLMKGRTSIVIAHRLSTIQNADKIFMLENGKIVEEGNYNELMAKNGKFHELANPEHLIIN